MFLLVGLCFGEQMGCGDRDQHARDESKQEAQIVLSQPAHQGIGDEGADRCRNIAMIPALFTSAATMANATIQ